MEIGDPNYWNGGWIEFLLKLGVYLISEFLALPRLLAIKLAAGEPGQVALALTSMAGVWTLLALLWRWLLAFGTVFGIAVGARVFGVV